MDASIPSSSKSPLHTTTLMAQPSADPITITLAQRLDELAVANSEGLLKATDWSGSQSVPASPSISRSTTRSHRAAPPSSFTAKGSSREARQASSGSSDDVGEDEHLQKAQDIRQEIELIEAEARRLLDAFNGLELSALVRVQRPPGPHTAIPSSVSDSEGRLRSGSVSMSPKGSSIRLARDHDSMSIRSSQSIQTMFSAHKAPSTHSKLQRPPNGTLPPSLGPGSLPRKDSVSSMSVHSRKSGHATVPKSPSVPRTPSKFRLGSQSSLNLSRSAIHLPLETVSESETQQRPHSPAWSGHDSASAMRVDGEGADASAVEEMADIRRRRMEVTARYEARLEYLRARLRGAELREKLMKS
ncbi:hypothetical protein EIP91_003993 [Steccherinum ochraceum]|uniref:Uncharacterized protein n=1 Tax=Steccherinum ochraceum TaxID=92696 RepID=A0A4R0RC47_9APHY|nr:hypothetical protein EIP91_003993 [Steccherinum ochraceum]